jgi:hypothetical protein
MMCVRYENNPASGLGDMVRKQNADARTDRRTHAQTDRRADAITPRRLIRRAGDKNRGIKLNNQNGNLCRNEGGDTYLAITPDVRQNKNCPELARALDAHDWATMLHRARRAPSPLSPLKMP